MLVGIDDMDMYVAPFSLDSKELSLKRTFPEKTVQEVGFTARSIVPCYEDVVTQAVNAAQSLTAGKEDQYKLLILGTESSLDFGKPISTYVQKYLNLNQNCTNFEIKHACYSGTAAVRLATSWVQAREDNAKALVIMSDLARAHLDDSAEITSGSGAVAISISKNPKILALDKINGTATKEVYDVARPTVDFEWGDPLLSLYAFLDLAEIAWNDFSRKTGIKNLETAFDYMLYHIPLISLAKKTHHTLLELCNPDLNLDQSKASFQKMVEPSLAYNRLVSNVYSGSIWTSLLSLIDHNPQLKEGTKIGFFSYGSGACAEFFTGQIGSDAYKLLQEKKLALRFKQRQNISVAEYEEAIKKTMTLLSIKEYSPDYNQFKNAFDTHYKNQKKLVLENIDNYHRSYRWS